MTRGYARKGWDIDLKDGIERENAFATIMKHSLVEHKSDEKCKDTGNIYIEVMCSNKKSGISISTAEFWAIEFLPERWLIIRTEELKPYVNKAFKLGLIVCGGDDNKTIGALVPINWLLK